MPIPKPNQDEKESEFISRCMSDEVMNKDYPEQEQRAGVCYTQWKNKGESMEEKKEEVKKSDVKRDEKGRMIVAENVHFIINASIKGGKSGN